MSLKHVVKQGEHLSRIAALHGFSDFKPIWSFPENAELKKVRKDPHILFPGDVVAIPAPREKTVTKPAGAAHDFTLAAGQLRINLQMLDPFFKPIADEPCEAQRAGRGIDGSPQGLERDTLTSDKEGKVGFTVNALTQDAELAVFTSVPLPSPIPLPPLKEKFDLLIGGLDPVTTDSGLRGRLNNLGYFAGLGDGFEDREQLFWAIEEFQFDHKIKDPNTGLPNGRDFDDPNRNKTVKPTRAKLVQVHGDKEPL